MGTGTRVLLSDGETVAQGFVVLNNDGENVFGAGQSGGGGDSVSLGFTISGRIRDISRDLTFTYSDGKAETYYFTSSGDAAGKSVRI